ncbi:MAG: outer membrane beta-barrel protein [Polyangiaceae bacterium]
MRKLAPLIPTLLLNALLCHSARAQDPPPPSSAAPPLDPAAPPPPADPASPPPTPSAPTPKTPAEPTSPAPAADAAPAPEKPTPWYERFSIEAFVDSYVSVNFNFPEPQQNANRFRAYDVNNGASIHWAGLNVTYPANPVGATLSLRFGPSVPIYALGDAGTFLEYVKQAFVTLRPGGDTGKFQLDFGKADTLVGAEVADNQLNINYTRGLVNFIAQPFFHTGFRAAYTPIPEVSIKAILVNGANNSIDNNTGKSGGAQFVFTDTKRVTASLAYLFGPEQPDTLVLTCPVDTAPQDGACVSSPGAPESETTIEDGAANARFRHLADVVLDAKPTDEVRLLFNGDVGAEQQSGGDYALWVGASLASSFKVAEIFSLGLRAEVLWDQKGFVSAVGDEVILGSGTLTAQLTPWEHFSAFFDVRGDGGDRPYFLTGVDGARRFQFTTTLGMIVSTGS